MRSTDRLRAFPSRSRPPGPRAGLRLAIALGLLLAGGAPASGQTTGQITGRVLELESREAIPAAEVSLEGGRRRAIVSERGRFVLAGVPAGVHTLRVERIGYRPVLLEGIRVLAGRTVAVTVEMQLAPVEMEGIAAEVERAPLIEPDVSMSHELVLGEELRELPVDEVEEAVELATGVTDGHFRGGRVGQETYRIDGLDVKNQFSASSQGSILEVAPTALEAIDVVTGGFGAGNGSALSGVVSYVTRRGDSESWEGRASITTDQWAPDALFRGFTELSLSAGGPLPLIGDGATLFADLLAQGLVDGDPRARGLTCLEPGDAEDPDLVETMGSLTRDPRTASLYCPFTGGRLPYQRGDRLIGFARLDRPLGSSANLTLSVLHNRRQQELYTPEFKYNPDHQLGQRRRGTLLNLSLDWTRHREGRAYHVTFRGALLRLDRHLGALDPWTFNGRSRVAGFGLSDFRFLGEEYVHRDIVEQLEDPAAVPGYVQPGGSVGSPFGPGGAGIFPTEGTPGIANWNRSDMAGADLVAEVLSAEGHTIRVGGSARLYRIESYERALAFLAGSAPTYARFYPATAAGFAQLRLAAADEVTVDLGLRFEGFRSGLSFQEDRSDFLGPVEEPGWRTAIMPRIGMAVPLPASEGRTMFRFNYGRVAQPPDFRLFLDTTIGDSLRSDIRRQGNPDLAFERGSAYEVGITHLLSDELAVGATAFLKELTSLVTGSLSFAGTAENQFTTGDFGSVKGIELTVRGRWPHVRLQAGYALQSAVGVTSGALDDPEEEITDERQEFPLAFDRRHSADLHVAVSDLLPSWSAALTASLQSGFPLDRRLAAGELVEDIGRPDRLPWTWLANLRVVRELGSFPACESCRWRVMLDARNVFGRDNVIALRRDTGTLAPPSDEVLGAADDVPDDMVPIPQESPDYSQLADRNRDGRISADELRTARIAAALDRNDPSLFFGEARELRIGLEMTF